MAQNGKTAEQFNVGEQSLVNEVERGNWLIVVGAFLVLFLGPGMVISTFSVFFGALLEATSWTRTSISLASSLNLVLFGLFGPLAGRWSQNLGPRRVLSLGSLALGACLVLLSFVQEVWQFCLLYACLGAAASMLGMVPMTVLISRWFVAKRGLALGLSFAGFGIAGFVFAPLTNALIANLGWRQVYLLLSVPGGLLAFAVVLATIRDGPEHSAPPQRPSEGRPVGSTQAAVGSLGMRDALRSLPFWLITAAGFLFAGIFSSVAAHTVPLALDRGLDKAAAAVAIGFVIGMGAVGKIGMGYLADRFDGKWVLTGTYSLLTLALLLAVLSERPDSFWVFVTLFGVAQGGVITVPALLMGRLYGHQAVGEIIGVSLLVGTIGSFIGPLSAGAMREITDSYGLVLAVLTGAALLSTLLVALIPARRAAAT